MAEAEDGRRYHDTSSGYSLPNDSTEHMRLDAQSRALTTMMGGRTFLTDISTLAKKPTPFRAIDIGCGTGLMTTTLAHQTGDTANAEIYGVDISPVPALHAKPASVQYVQANVMDLIGQDTRFSPGSFDFVTHRLLVLGITDLRSYLQTCFNLLKPGGRIELQDTALRFYSAAGTEISQSWKWLRIFHKAGLKFGIDFTATSHFAQLFEEIGFVDVEAREFKWTLTSEHWEMYPDSDEIGKYSEEVLNKYFPLGVCKMSQRAGFTTAQDLEGLASLDEVKLDYDRTLTTVAKGSHTKFYVVTGRKP